jgi:hypothetical protein
MAEEKAGPGKLYLTLLIVLILLAWIIAVKSCESAKVQSVRAAELDATAMESKVNFITARAMNMEGIFDPLWQFKLEKTREFFSKPEGYYRISKSSYKEIPKIKAVLDSYGLLSSPQTLKKEELINNLQKLEDAFSKLRLISEEGGGKVGQLKIKN